MVDVSHCDLCYSDRGVHYASPIITGVLEGVNSICGRCDAAIIDAMVATSKVLKRKRLGVVVS